MRTRPSPLRWSTAHLIAVSRLPQVTAFIPFIGYAILFNEYLRDKLSLWDELNDGWLDTDTRLLCLWWGAVFMMFGWVLYRIFCPSMIQRNGSVSNFVAEQRCNPSLDRLVEAASISKEHAKQYDSIDTRPLLYAGRSPNQVYQAVELAKNANQRAALSDNLFDVRHATTVETLFAVTFIVVDHKRPFARYASIALLYLGAAIFLTPAVVASWQVLQYTVDRTLPY